MATFSDLGIDLPLCAADVGEAAGWATSGRCAIGDEERAGFQIAMPSGAPRT